MPNNKNHKDNLKNFPKGKSGNPKGRPPNILNHLGELVKVDFNLKLTKQDKYRLIEWMLERTIPELKRIAKSSKVPAFIVVAAKAITKDLELSKMNTMETILDRIFGKPKQEVLSNVNLRPINENRPDISKLTDEELNTYMALIKKASPNNNNDE